MCSVDLLGICFGGGMKENVIRRCEAGYERTELGTRMLEALS